MTYFQFVRIYSAFECLLFLSLLVVWLGELSAGAKTVLGWTHGFGWILLCLLVLWGWLRRVFPGPLLAATVSPLGPLGALIGFELLVRTTGDRGTFPADVSAEPAEPADAAPDPAGSGARRGAAGGDAE